MRATHTLTGESIRQRPSYSDAAVLSLAARLMWARLRTNGALDEDDAEAPEAEALEQLEDALSTYSDGFDIGKYLDSHGWVITADMVETLDGGARDEAHSRLVKEWVADEGIRPSLSVGAIVTYKGHPGEITAIHEREATYTVFVEAEGHVRSGVGRNGFIVAYEDIEAA